MTEDIQGWFAQGEQLANQGFYRKALAQFDQVIKLQPDHAAAWVCRAVALIHLEQYAAALESCDRALSLCHSACPLAAATESEAWLFRGVALQRLNRYAEAYTSYENALGDRQTAPAVEPGQQGLFWLLRDSLAAIWQSFRMVD